MGISLLLESMITAVSVGTGCGTCCGSGISAALYGYLVTHVKNIRQSMLSFVDFFLGKLLAVVSLCAAASLLGRSIIDSDGLLFGVNVHIIVNILIIFTIPSVSSAPFKRIVVIGFFFGSGSAIFR